MLHGMIDQILLFRDVPGPSAALRPAAVAPLTLMKFATCKVETGRFWTLERVGHPDDPSHESLPEGHFWRKQTENHVILRRPESKLAGLSKEIENVGTIRLFALTYLMRFHCPRRVHMEPKSLMLLLAGGGRWPHSFCL
jgi:hypothetical protein